MFAKRAATFVGPFTGSPGSSRCLRPNCYVSGLLLFCLYLGACSSESRKNPVENEQTTPATTQASAQPTATSLNWKAKAVVYGVYKPHDQVSPSQDPGIWLYDPESGDIKSLAPFPKDVVFRSPRFRNEKQISFIRTEQSQSSRDSLELFDIQTNQRSRFISPSTASLLDCDWRRDADAVACIEADFTKDSVHRVVVHESDGSIHAIRTIGVPPGRGAGKDDEVSVTWSKDGSKLLIVDTHVDYVFEGNKARPADTVRVIDAEGRDLIEPLRGTQARWSPEERFLYFREWNRPESTGGWVTMDLKTGERTPLQMRAKGYHAVLSPEGRYIAYSYDSHSNEDSNVVYSYDLVTRSDKRIATGYQYPIWLRPGVIAATKVKTCRAGTSGCMVIEGWLGQGAWSIPIDGSPPERLQLGSTLFDAIDVLYE